jgi:hypothetical protein
MKVKSRIGWWIISPASEVFDYIRSSCVKENVDTTQILFTKAEQEMVLDIIKTFQEKTKNWYLSCRDFPNRTIEKLPKSYYFMYYFEEFLDEHNDLCFNGHKMYIVIRKEDNVEDCSITDYGMVYNKLFYVVRLFCKSNKKLDEIKYYYLDGIKKKLDTRETTFITHRL